MVVRIGQLTAKPRRVFFREWREHRDLTQDQLAELLGTNKSAVSKMETGKSRYNQSSLEAWGRALRCEPSALISRLPTEDDVDYLFRRASAERQRIVLDILKNAEPD